MTKESIPLRAHQGMCLAFFRGEGYSDSFSAHMQAVLHRLQKEKPPLELLAEADIICGGCPNLQDGVCRSAALVSDYDRQVLSLCGLAEHTKTDWATFSALVEENILAKGKRESICGGCQWTALCK